MKKLMSDADKTKRELIQELALLRKKVAKLEGAARISPGDDRENFHKSIIESVKEGIWVASPQDVIIYTNKGMIEIAGIPKSKIIGRHVLSGFSEETLQNFRSFYQKAQKTLRPLQYEALVVTPSKRETWQAGWLIPLTLKGRFNGMLCTTQDVTLQRQTQDQCRTILKTTQDGFVLLDMQGRFLDVNNAYCSMTGYSRDELLKMSIRDIETVESHREIKKHISEIQKHGSALFETRQRRKDGSIIDVEVSVSYLGAGADKMVNLSRDITGRKHMENALRQSEVTARTLLNIPSAAIMLFDTNANLIEFNDTVVKRFQMSRQKLTGKSLWDIIPPHIAKLRKKFFSQTLSTGEMVRWEDEREGMWNDNSFIPIVNERGDIERVIGFAVDITATKQAEILLKESEGRYRTIFETCAEGILIVDIESRHITFANPAICAMLGYTLKGLQMKRLSDIHPKEALKKVRHHFDEIAMGRRLTASATPCRRKDGSVIYTNISGTKMVIDGREYNVGFFTDITERRAIEKKLRESEALFRQTFEHAPIGIAIFDKKGAVININSFLADMLNYSAEELKAGGVDAHLHTESKTKSMRALLSKPLTLRKPVFYEKRYIAREGTTVFVKEYVQGIFSKEDELTYVIALMEDITAQNHTENQNINIITKLKAVYNELHEFSKMLPDDQSFSSLASIQDYKLSPMENKVASLIYHGYTNNKIASKLNISENTVKHHITSIFSAFKVKSRLELANTIREKRMIM
jgi:PAS domain S-box-containing protein